MRNEETARRLQEAMDDKRITAHTLSERSGVGEPSISQYLHGLYAPRSKTAGKLADVLGVNPMWLMNFPGAPKKSENANFLETRRPTPHRIPVLGRVAAGIPIEATQDVVDYEEVDDKLASLGDLFGLRIKGDSMAPRICDGDVVIVHQQPEAESGEIVIATINGNDAVCKKMMVYGDTVLLRSNNPAYDDIDVTGRDDFRILGKVVELRGKL